MRYDLSGNILAEQIASPVVIVQPDIEPVDLTSMKRHLRIDEDQNEDNEDIEQLITAGREFVEKETGLALIDQTLELRLEGYPVSRAITLRGPLLSFVSFQYTDSEGSLQTVETDQYIVESSTRNVVPRLVPAYNVTWPSSQAVSDALRIQWRAGFADRTGSPTEGAEQVPAALRNAIKLHAEAHYDRDERTMKMLMDSAVFLCRPYKVSFGLA